eukprot:symbB.v1.2.041227.t1/scaffold7949.1/size8494/1
MTTQAKNSMMLRAKSSFSAWRCVFDVRGLKYLPHQWFDIQKSSLAKESQTQRRNFRRAYPDLAAPRPRVSPDDLEDPAKTIVLPSEIFAATWTASISRVGTIQGTGGGHGADFGSILSSRGARTCTSSHSSTAHGSSTGEIYQLGGPVKGNLALPRVCTAPDLRNIKVGLAEGIGVPALDMSPALKEVGWSKLPDGPRVAGIPMQNEISEISEIGASLASDFCRSCPTDAPCCSVLLGPW